ncbi:SET and MYND protein [Fusarium austroafricanum]|uniref:SET and MYND protein n=1 Tax=Fusarium austroafricanum TaxID=2364996 RepID=A0A8H4KCU4_9HYPO|nr:SET and MYND protein [Fusarium austroafricanum]
MNQSTPFQVKRHHKGRGIFSTKTFAPGDIILPFTPTILIPSLSHIKSVCSHCFKPADVHACSCCHAVSYCDTTCQSANWTAIHSKECKLLQKVTEQGHPGLPTPVRAVVQALVKPQIGAALEDLEGNVESWRGSDKWADMEMMAMGAAAFTRLGIGQEELQRTLALLCKIQTNAFHRYDADLGQVGVFLEPKLAMANHSCIPNAMVQFVGRKAILRAEKPISVDDEIEISYADYTFPLSKRREALAPYFFKCQCIRCEKDLNIYQVCASSPIIDMNRHSLVADIGKLGQHPAATDSEKASTARSYSAELSDLINEKDHNLSPEDRRATLRARYQQCKGLTSEKLWAVSPLPQLLTEISILYIEESNFVYALAMGCFVAISCDPYRHVLPYHPLRVKGLLLVAKLLANTAADTASLGSSQAVASKRDLNQRALQTLQDIDQISLCQMLLIMILKSFPKHYVQEWEVSATAEQMLDEINELSGREQELSLINAWREDPEADQARAFFEYAVVKQADALANLGLEILEMDFGQ